MAGLTPKTHKRWALESSSEYNEVTMQDATSPAFFRRVEERFERY